MKQRKAGFNPTIGSFFVGKDSMATREFCNYAQLITDVYQQGILEEWRIEKWGIATVFELFDIMADELSGTLDKRLRLEVY